MTAYDKKPIFTNEMLVYDGKYYIISEEHKEFVPDKMSDPDYYILTLAAVARELYLQNRTSARVYLAVGLPLTWVSEQRDNFKAYLLQNEAVDFDYKGTDYHVEFAGASVYPQGFAAVAGIVKRFQGLHMLCDIGNGTMNVMRITDGKVMQKECYTEQYGTRQCMLAVRENLMQKCHVKLDEPVIEQVLRFKKADISQRIQDGIADAALPDDSRCLGSGDSSYTARTSYGRTAGGGLERRGRFHERILDKDRGGAKCALPQYSNRRIYEYTEEYEMQVSPQNRSPG